MAKFRIFRGLVRFSFKEIDKFLYLEGAPRTPLPAERQPAGAFDYDPSEETVSRSHS